MKRYPGILFLTVCAAAFVTWYGVHWWYFEVPYNGETNLKVFFPGDGAAPQTLSKSNIYYSFVMTVDAQMDTPRDEKSINTTTAKFWQVNITFDKEVKADANLLASGLSSDFMLEIRNFNPRSAFVTIVPAKMTPDKPVVYPRGMLEIKVEPRLSNSK